MDTPQNLDQFRKSLERVYQADIKQCLPPSGQYLKVTWIFTPNREPNNIKKIVGRISLYTDNSIANYKEYLFVPDDPQLINYQFLKVKSYLNSKEFEIADFTHYPL